MNVLRIFATIASVLITVSPLVAQAKHQESSPRAEAQRHAAAARPAPAARPERVMQPRTYARPVVHERAAAPRIYARPAVHERAAAPRVYAHPMIHERAAAPRVYARPAIHERNAAPRYIAPRYVAPRYVAPRYVAPRYVAPRYVAPRAAPRYFARRNSFVRYYPRTYAPVVRRHVVFHRYVPQRVFLAPPVQVVRTYSVAPTYVGTASIPVSYVYNGYVPVYGSYPTTTYYSAPSMPLPLPIAYDDPYNQPYDYGQYQYGQYTSYPQYPYNGTPVPYGNYNQFGAAPFGNAQLQGVVIASTGSGILVMTPSMKPVFVNTSIAQQNGYLNGNIQAGSFVNVFGYDTGNEFIATAIG